MRKRRGSINLEPKIDPNEEFLTTAQVAKLTGMSEAWYERMRWAMTGPPYLKQGRAVRYAKSEVLAWWARGRVPGKPRGQ